MASSRFGDRLRDHAIDISNTLKSPDAAIGAFLASPASVHRAARWPLRPADHLIRNHEAPIGQWDLRLVDAGHLTIVPRVGSDNAPSWEPLTIGLRLVYVVGWGRAGCG